MIIMMCVCVLVSPVYYKPSVRKDPEAVLGVWRPEPRVKPSP